MTNLPHLNQDQIDYWSGPSGERWAAEQAEMDLVIGPLGMAAMDAARVTPGEHVLDVGCGCGDTTLALAERVGSGGHVVGVDVSRPMLARARARTAGSASIELREGDASVAELPQVDLLFSRFGVMFFADPLQAFTHLRGAVRDRLAFVCWRKAADNEWATLPTSAIAPCLPAEPPPEPHAPGPFAFADRDRLAGILVGAGFRDVVIEPLDRKLKWSRSPELAVGVRFLSRIGPAARRLADAAPDARAAALDALTTALGPHQRATGLELDAAVWIVTARV